VSRRERRGRGWRGTDLKLTPKELIRRECSSVRVLESWREEPTGARAGPGLTLHLSGDFVRDLNGISISGAGGASGRDMVCDALVCQAWWVQMQRNAACITAGMAKVAMARTERGQSRVRALEPMPAADVTLDHT
jgi:hypothetical protein